jgi:hypothetical protein
MGPARGRVKDEVRGEFVVPALAGLLLPGPLKRELRTADLKLDKSSPDGKRCLGMPVAHYPDWNTIRSPDRRRYIMANPSNRGREESRPASGGQAGQETRKGSSPGSRQGGQSKGEEGTTHRLEQAWDTTKQQAQNLASAAEGAWGNVSDVFNRYPMAYFLVGVGLGFLVAQALSRPTADMPRRMSQASAR